MPSDTNTDLHAKSSLSDQKQNNEQYETQNNKDVEEHTAKNTSALLTPEQKSDSSLPDTKKETKKALRVENNHPSSSSSTSPKHRIKYEKTKIIEGRLIY